MIIDFLLKSWRIVCFIFLALVCGGQVYPSVHLHHFHTDDAIAFKVSSHPPATATEHTTTHHHHQENSSHEDENEHKYKKKTAWRNVARSKSTVNMAFDAIGQPVFNLLPFIEFEAALSFPATSVQLQEDYGSSGSIRGPPPLV